MRRAALNLGCILSILASSIASYGAPGLGTAVVITSATPTPNARSITLPHFEPDLPSAPGRDAYLAVCVSCHSPRYVTMQPLFSEKQWGDTVDKMVKVYGAQMDPAQRESILQYLLGIHGPDSQTQRAPQEEDSFEPTPPVQVTESAPVLQLASEASERARELSRGGDVYRQNCLGCHGPGGRGDGFVAPVLLRKPKDLASMRFAPQLLIQVLWNGKPGTAMPSWRGLPQQDLAAVAAYVQSLHQSTGNRQPSSEAMQRGNQVFQINCAPCHGVEGDGNGPSAAALLPRPANFKLKQPDYAYILQVVSEGIPGTSMPAWKNQLPESDREALGDYVRSLFKANESRGP